MSGLNAFREISFWGSVCRLCLVQLPVIKLQICCLDCLKKDLMTSFCNLNTPLFSVFFPCYHYQNTTMQLMFFSQL